jgi:ketosteroid isomerase-like protein
MLMAFPWVDKPFWIAPHEQPLRYSGVAALREICQAGLDAATDAFRWDIPDLKIIIRGDIAVTWGLNRMRFEPAGNPASESWSRGTRIFQKLDGRWQMIHQHVSYPMDPESGKASTDLEP